MITLKKFIDETKGTKVALPNGNQKGQCVSLAQQYLIQCFGIPFKARGHAKDFGKSLVKDGLAVQVSEPKVGDLIIYSATLKNIYGHIAIYIDKNKMYDQNNTTHDNKCAGYSKILSGKKTYFRINTTYTAGDYQLLYSKAVRRTHELGNNIIKVGDLRPATRKWCTTPNKLTAQAKLKVGSPCRINAIYKESNGRVWGGFGNYWIVLQNADGTPQATRI